MVRKQQVGAAEQGHRQHDGPEAEASESAGEAGKRNRHNQLRKRPEQNGVMYTAAGVSGNAHLQPRHGAGNQREQQDRPGWCTPKKGNQKYGGQEGGKQQVPARFAGNATQPSGTPLQWGGGCEFGPFDALPDPVPEQRLSPNTLGEKACLGRQLRRVEAGIATESR